MNPHANGYKPLFPYFGGSSPVADIVWKGLGPVHTYTEPFFGSGAVWFLCPWPDVITRAIVNDADGMIANFWRALAADPDGVARWANWPVNECDLHARHAWLVARKPQLTEWIMTDPDYYHTKIAGWWVWGLCQWIGSGWCKEVKKQRPHLGNAGIGMHRPPRKRPHLGNAGIGMHRPHDEIGIDHDLLYWFRDRLRRVFVACGDWSRVCGPTPTYKRGLTGIFLDPPYAHDERDPHLYAEDEDVSSEVRTWALANGDNPLMRIILKGYAGEHDMPETWTTYAWKAQGGYGSQSNGRGRENAARERLWFSPHCLPIEDAQMALW